MSPNRSSPSFATSRPLRALVVFRGSLVGVQGRLQMIQPRLGWGQKWRAGSGRWANSGGSNRDWYKMFYAAKQSNNPQRMKQFLDEHGDRFVTSSTAGGPHELKEFLRSRPSASASAGAYLR